MAAFTVSMENRAVAKNVHLRCQVTWVWILASAMTRYIMLGEWLSFVVQAYVLLLSLSHSHIFLCWLGSLEGLTLKKWPGLNDQYSCSMFSGNLCSIAPVIFPTINQLHPRPASLIHLQDTVLQERDGSRVTFGFCSWSGRQPIEAVLYLLICEYALYSEVGKSRFIVLSMQNTDLIHLLFINMRTVNLLLSTPLYSSF